MKLTKDLYLIQQKEQPIMLNAMLSSIFMQSDKKEMTFGEVKNMTDNIYQYIKSKKSKTFLC